MEEKEYHYSNPVIRWIDDRLPVFSIFRRHYADHLMPRYFNKGWNLIVSVMLVICILSGFLVALHYVPHEDLAFASVERMMRDVDYGWLIRYLHLNGASFLFIATYIHVFRSILYGSFKKPRELVWIFGVIILFLLVASAFTGYVLTYSQMGGWAATVITSMFTAIPFIGDGLMQMILGGPSAGTPTLTRFYAFHFVIPFVILFFVFAHIWALRVALAKKPLDPLHYEDREVVPFYPYHTFKGLFWLAVFLCIYMVFTFFFPEALSPAGHFIPFDPLNMPEQILPEWYLLPFYGMLKAITFGINIYIAAGMAFLATAVVAACREKIFRAGKFSALILSGIFLCLLGYAGQINTGAGSGFLNLPLAGFFLISAKSAGVLAMFGIFIVLFLLPWLDTHKTRNGIKRPVFRLTLAGFVISVIALGVSGAMPPEPLWAAIGLAGAAYYYAWFLITLPLLSRFEKIES